MSSINPTGGGINSFPLPFLCKLTHPFVLKVHFKANYKRIQCLWIQYVGKTLEALW